ncbi:hypothetical protein N800_06285 [Lysobacter daejeonensis GH1-9]|uniref:Uncharacterized protein n=1 Tax=Lysobacter daejeonensis GH1-9 TaxID=1385517 RepID=A0A0A0EUC7_9GAMM|nr:hypothetical protein [Lysobacter daejeonensis]KGM53733.1 hypothetical protein N800_06285 [Lysobacter daejeonensis GH1-9]
MAGELLQALRSPATLFVRGARRSQGFGVAFRRGITLQDLRDAVAIHTTSAKEVVLMRLA